MQKFVSTFLAVLLAVTPVMANAQDTYTRFRMPAGHRCTVGTDTFQCFNLGEYVELLHMDEDLRNLTITNGQIVAQVATLTAASTELRLSLDAATQQVSLLTADRDRIQGLLTQANTRIHDMQNQPDWSWIPWTLAGGFAIATLVLGLIVGLR